MPAQIAEAINDSIIPAKLIICSYLVITKYARLDAEMLMNVPI
jgi:hypothetical protein